mmetsp:Transcript_30458/g.61999  ORF Transcript_30458/g.61999 Transcript_30458/m.61999 type:complete len:474 (+) Transcript_30458:72-1493(+)
MKIAIVFSLLTSTLGFRQPLRLPHATVEHLRFRKHSKRAALVPLTVPLDLDVDLSPLSAKPEDWLDKLNHRIDGGLGSVILLAATAVSVGLANTAHASGWLSFWNLPSALRIGQEALSFRAIVNECLMALFFFYVGLEIKLEVVGGSLSSIRSASLPCIAACGGMLVPVAVCALTILATGGPTSSMSSVVVPMATDIAFAMGVFSLFGGSKKFPSSVSAFLLTLATVDDIGAILVIATCFAHHISLPFLGAAACVQAMLVAMEKRRVSIGKLFLPVGAALWYCLFRAGVNADIAGVLAGLCVFASKDDTEIVHRLARRWKPICALAIMPLFALANTAIPVVGPAALAAATAAASGGATVAAKKQVANVASGIFLGLSIGKPLGIIGSTWLAVKLGLADMPEGMTNTHLGVVGLLGGIGFTMCIFLIEQAIPAGRTSTLSKIACIAASCISAMLGALVMLRAPYAGKEPPQKAA